MQVRQLVVSGTEQVRQKESWQLRQAPLEGTLLKGAEQAAHEPSALQMEQGGSQRTQSPLVLGV